MLYPLSSIQRRYSLSSRRGVALLAVLGILAVLLILLFGIIGGQANNGAQTLTAQAQAAAACEERAGVVRALSRWMADGQPARFSIHVPPLEKAFPRVNTVLMAPVEKAPAPTAQAEPAIAAATASTTGGAAREGRTGQVGGARAQRSGVDLAIRQGAAGDTAYADAGLPYQPGDVWIESQTPVTGQGSARRAVYLCRQAEWSKRVLVSEQLVLAGQNP